MEFKLLPNPLGFMMQQTNAAGSAVQELEANLTESSQALASMQRELHGRVQQLDALTDHVRGQDADLAALRLQLPQPAG